MSFSYDVKRELCKIEPKNTCCERAEGYGLLLFSKCFGLQEKSVLIEHAAAARRLAESAAACTGVIPELRVNLRRKGFVFSVPGLAQREQMLAAFGHGGILPPCIRGENLPNTCCQQAFLRGAFLSCGQVSDPNKRYQLEFVLSHRETAQSFATFLRSLPGLTFLPGISKRQSGVVVYFKDSQQIENLLTFIGASSASMGLMQVKMLKEAMADINRKSNFETANIDKTISASAKQTAAIAAISDVHGLASLGTDLQAVAELRLHNPNMTLKEMSEALGLSRSGVNHKLQRLLALGEKLLQRDIWEDQ